MTQNCKHPVLTVANGTSTCQRCLKVIDAKSLTELYLEKIQKRGKIGDLRRSISKDGKLVV